MTIKPAFNHDDPDLSSFDGLSLAAAIRRLRDRGYAQDDHGDGTMIFTPPAETGRIIRLSLFPETARLFASLCHEKRDNPYFPRLTAARAIEGTPPYFLTVSERLEDARALTAPQRAPLVGMARALSLLLAGDEAHAAAHKQMLRNPALRDAVQAIARTIHSSITNPATNEFLFYDHGTDRNLPVEQQESANILFRRHDGRYQPVFNAPFRTGLLGAPAQRAALQDYARLILQRAEIDNGPAAPAGPHKPRR